MQRATGHTEVVLVVYDPTVITDEELLGVFLEGHQPTEGLSPGNDVGTPYRSAIYRTSANQAATTSEVADRFQDSLQHARHGTITLRSRRRGEFHSAEPYHQHYLEADPRGYCGLRGTGCVLN